MLAVCHTVMIEEKLLEGGKLSYSASSPDELALVKGSSEAGIEYVKRTTSRITIKLANGSVEEYEAIVEFPFDSTRKRMSLIVKSLTEDQYYIMTKGADSIMMPRIIVDIQTQA